MIDNSIGVEAEPSGASMTLRLAEATNIGPLLGMSHRHGKKQQHSEATHVTCSKSEYCWHSRCTEDHAKVGVTPGDSDCISQAPVTAVVSLPALALRAWAQPCKFLRPCLLSQPVLHQEMILILA